MTPRSTSRVELMMGNLVRPSDAALIIKGIKVNLTPASAAAGFSCARTSLSESQTMSSQYKNWGIVHASVITLVMVRLRPRMGSSRSAGAATEPAVARAPGATGEAATGGVAGDGSRRTSSLRMRPRLPLPTMVDRSMPRSRATRRTAGVARTGPDGVVVDGDAGWDEEESEEEGGGGVVSSEVVVVVEEEEEERSDDASASSTSMVQRTEPTLAMSPSAYARLVTVPLYLLVISTVALSDSTSTNGSNESTLSPGDTVHDLISTSAVPSPMSVR
mmetsp:Transcript_11286/g.35820  ORF Transcript_11286/g.35820 Transcript_11286/m.35820 type:complete len:275 (+) Transcript_11286:852-1676(+)